MNMRFLGPAGLAVAAMLCASAVRADTQSELARCAQIRDDAERLECFDRATRAEPASPDVPAPAPPPGLPPPAATPSASAPPAPAAAPSTDAAPAETEETFGAEQTRQETREELQSIRSQIVGYFEGFYGGTEVQLANGQIWVQQDAARLWVKRENPEIVIERGFFGGYRLSVEGHNRSIRVKRIK